MLRLVVFTRVFAGQIERNLIIQLASQGAPLKNAVTIEEDVPFLAYHIEVTFEG